ncbi:F-box domain, FBD domain, Leucine-rich repeat domain, L domain-like protein [Artemisia annua]|uniref:F-box domain, FBD domain, Leucine-rich repeat domain, L domain-like protein n=1 Tax=Artemisia annua TaxID=35608 RepID=A0A2U1MPV7_ARTAN|nr:F-box domain, FBD domain, Leucine-rich repeat domain, L domain-like protein [Artemisia annua]
MTKSKRAKVLKDENGVDLISSMPDPILELILLCLPIADVVRTSILSTRWRNLWTSIPVFPSLDIDCSQVIEFKKDIFQEFVSKVLANNTRDLETFRLNCANDYYNISTITKWIQEAVMRKVKSLDLTFSNSNKYSFTRFPICLLQCYSLEVLRLCFCSPNLYSLSKIGFQELRVLELNNVKLVSDTSIAVFLKRCPLLEDLSLIDCSMMSSDTLHMYKRCMCDLHISGPKLVILEYGGNLAYKYHVITFENLHSLKKAMIYPEDMSHKDLSTESMMGDNICELFPSVSHVCIYAARDLKGQFPASLPNLKTLELTTTINAFTMNVLIRILRCCPNLESLHLLIEKVQLMTEYWALHEIETRKLLTDHLKTVKFLRFNGKKRRVGIARFLIQHGNALEKMLFSWRSKVRYNDKSMKLMNKMSKLYKASSTVKLISHLDE